MATFEDNADRLTILTACGGITATIKSISVVGILDKAYVEVQGVESEAPTFTCRTSDVPSAVHGDSVVASGTNYSIRGIQPDGTGITVLILEEA